MDFYKVLVIGSSGTGKTYAAENLPEETTALINVEDKPLPWNKKFKLHSRPRTSVEVINSLVEAGKDDSIKVILFDSFSMYMDIVLREARATKKGFAKSSPCKSYLIDWEALRVLHTPYSSNDYSIVKEVRIG